MSATLATCTSWWSKPALATAVAQLARRGAQRGETRRHVQGNVMLHQRRLRQNVLLFLDKQLVGVLSFNQIEPQNKTAYIGYWIDEEHQGQGLLSRSLQAFIRHYAASGTGAPVCDQMPGGEHPQQPR
ncbi:GNAT family N-acetyltransferase [Klebsiella pneumoniae subsp. pneumoniae]|nr:GNAT family N-acetyltransferase [Klebsiella pneumoniae subsp. pneumoniae]